MASWQRCSILRTLSLFQSYIHIIILPNKGHNVWVKKIRDFKKGEENQGEKKRGEKRETRGKQEGEKEGKKGGKNDFFFFFNFDNN